MINKFQMYQSKSKIWKEEYLKLTRILEKAKN